MILNKTKKYHKQTRIKMNKCKSIMIHQSFKFKILKINHSILRIFSQVKKDAFFNQRIKLIKII